jgi:hypothetical protein
MPPHSMVSQQRKQRHSVSLTIVQATFRAHNVDYDSSDSEVDDTKELQIEEALKLYQTALRYHSEGPRSFQKARQAYLELLKSEIFTYSESLSEFRRWETLPEYDELLQQTFDPVAQTVLVAGDNAPNTLPQILHLSYKNYAQFMLDLLCNSVEESLAHPREDGSTRNEEVRSANNPLKLFAEALDKDDTDLDIWRRSARVSMWAGSYRIARFCLEAVLDGEQEGLESIFDAPGIDEMLALHELQDLTLKLKDDLSKHLGPLKTSMKRQLSAVMKKLVNPYPILKAKRYEEGILAANGHQGKEPASFIITVNTRDWNAVGEVILKQLTLQEDDEIDVGPGAGIGFKIPPPSDPGSVDAMEVVESPTKVPTPVLETQLTVPSIQPDTGTPAADDKSNDQLSNAEDESKTANVQAGDGASSNDPSQGDEQTTTQSSRKRSTESAGLQENPDGVRSRSKRIRASNRWTTGGDRIDTAQAEASKENVVNEVQQEALRLADFQSYETIQPILERLDVKNLVAPAVLENSVKDGHPNRDDDHVRFSTAVKDLFTALKSCEPRTIELLHIDSFSDQIVGVASRQAGLNVFLGHENRTGGDEIGKVNLVTDVGLDDWVDGINSSWCLTKDAAWKWLSALLRPKSSPRISGTPWSSYLYSAWSDELKETMRQIARTVGEYAYDNLREELDHIEARYLTEVAGSKPFELTFDEVATIDMIEALFEVQVDCFAHFKAETLTSNQHLRKKQQVRLNRWSQLAMNAVRLAPADNSQGEMEDLQVRHIWAQATYISLDEDTTQEYNLACVRDLHQLMRALDDRVIQLPNNDTIGELSMTTVEAKLRRMNMKDFFLRVFGDEKDDDDSALAIIQHLEPLLEMAESKTRKSHNDQEDELDSSETIMEESQPQNEQPDEVAEFIVSSSQTLRLALWRRLRDAYQALAYKPMIVYCDFRTIDLLVEELQSENYKNSTPTQRTNNLLRWLRLIDDLMLRALTLRTEIPDFLECIDAQQVKRSINSLAGISSILHAFRLLDDQVTVGQCQTPGPSSRNHSAFTNLSSKMNDMSLRAWTLQYILLKDAIEQHPERFTNPYEDRLNFLRAVHHAVGPRGVCNAAKRVFLRLERDELLELSDLPDANWETCQVLFDLYGLKCTQHLNDLADHGCEDPEPITRKEALKLLGFMLAQADKIPYKDLHKAELKTAIDKVHEALGRQKLSETSPMNIKAVKGYIKGPINPLNLYASLKGTLTLSTKTIAPADMPAASKGWYMLLGKMSYFKFRTAKRPLPQGTSVEDLDAAVSFFVQDLEYSSENWETWYRLGQTYDLQVEEAVSWNAEKLSGSGTEVLTLQRQAINCFAMAVSCAVRHGVEENHPNQSKLISQLYGDYGIRLYASSREPFSMKPFSIKESEERIFNRVHAPGSALMYKAPSFVTLKLFTAWRLAATLFREALRRAPDKWLYHYTLGKCLWKMYNASDEVVGKGRKPTMDEVIKAFVSAVRECPKVKHAKEEPILEPHYKIASIAHKLVLQGVDVSKGSEVVRASSYASKAPIPTDLDGWEEYILKILKTLRSADKASWHHRMTARAAQINYDGSGKDMFGAMAAKHEFTQQMFTKIMVLQVWRPAYERPGRHFVYKTRYMRFFIELLERTNDRSNYEMLVRRLRKKATDYSDHKELWQEVCIKYLKVCYETNNRWSFLTYYRCYVTRHRCLTVTMISSSRQLCTMSSFNALIP